MNHYTPDTFINSTLAAWFNRDPKFGAFLEPAGHRQNSTQHHWRMQWMMTHCGPLTVDSCEDWAIVIDKWGTYIEIFNLNLYTHQYEEGLNPIIDENEMFYTLSDPIEDVSFEYPFKQLRDYLEWGWANGFDVGHWIDPYQESGLFLGRVIGDLTTIEEADREILYQVLDINGIPLQDRFVVEPTMFFLAPKGLAMFEDQIVEQETATLADADVIEEIERLED